MRHRKRVAVFLLSSLILCLVPPHLTSAAEGELDPTFGVGGKVSLSFGLSSGDTEAQGLAIQPDGKIVVSGRYYTELTANGALARLNTDGSLDSTFGSGGVVRPAVTYGNIELQSDGKIVIAGIVQIRYHSDGTVDTSRSVLVRYNSNGTLDTSFGSGGQVMTGFFNYNLVIQPDQKIIVVGYFAYLHRDPDILYLDWVAKLNNPPAGQLPRDVYREMLNGFIGSQEYRRRFGPN